MFIHEHICISPQQTFGLINLEHSKEAVNNKLLALEPTYEGIPPGILRRMGKAVRMGTGAALPVIKAHPSINGFIIGTANGGMEDCIKFLNQIIDYEEGMLTPGNFVQSTPNAIAAQLGLMTHNKSYNITHVHRGLAFENALLDALMQLNDYPDHEYLVGAVDEISAYNYNIDLLEGWYKKEPITAAALYNSLTPGSLAGEGAAMFLVNNKKEGAVAEVIAVQTIHTPDAALVRATLEQLLNTYSGAGSAPDCLITGENGDLRLQHFYDGVELAFNGHTTIARYKQLSGEFPTSTGFALWLTCALKQLPAHCIKSAGDKTDHSGKMLIYNNYKGVQHSFILINRGT